jgi:hypothetical protein
MKQATYLLAFAVTSIASGATDIVEDALQRTPAGATDRVLRRQTTSEALDVNSLTVTVEVVYPSAFTSCYHPEPHRELQPKAGTFSPGAPVVLPPLIPEEYAESEE